MCSQNAKTRITSVKTILSVVLDEDKTVHIIQRRAFRNSILLLWTKVIVCGRVVYADLDE